MVVNLVLLGPFTLNYGHAGMVEPFVYVAKQELQHPRVMVVTPSSGGIYPWEYGGYSEVRPGAIRSWADLQLFDVNPWLKDSVAFYLLYPPNADSLPVFVDSIESRVGPIKQVFHAPPSLIDRTLHRFNPKYNPTKEVWVYKPD